MAEVIRQQLDTWHLGVVASEHTTWPPSGARRIAVDQLEPGSTPHAKNNAFAISGGRAMPGKRDGSTCMNRTPLTGSSAIIGQYAYRRRTDAGEITQYHLLISENGRFDWADETGAPTTIDAAAFTPGFFPPSFATLNNLAFLANGQEQVKFNGTDMQNFGIVRPDSSTVIANAGVAGSLSGEYEIRITYRNSATGAESSASDTAPNTVVTLDQGIDLTGLPVSTDPQVDTKGIYVRNIETQSEFYQIDIIPNADTTASVDGVDADLTIVAPDTSENDPPLSTVKYLAAHKNRMFAADDGKLYWSRTGQPEAFDIDAYDYVNQNDGQKITGLASIPGGYLIIFKEDSYYVLEGDTPGVWQISRLGPAVGCMTHASIVIGMDALYWWAEQGPVRMSFAELSVPELIGSNRIGGVMSRKVVNFLERRRICAGLDITGQRILFAFPEIRQDRNTRMVVWNSRLGCWESDNWDPMEVASLASVNDARNQPYVMMGGYGGQFFKQGLGKNDGVASGTTSGTFVAAATTQQTITSSGFDTTGAGLANRKVTILDSNLSPVTTSTRPYVSSNSATVLTLNKAINGLTVGATYTFVVGGPDWQFDTAWSDLGQPFDKKRLEQVYVLGLLYGRNLLVDIHRNKREDSIALARLGTVTGSGSLWNQVNWNAFNWNDAELTYDRLRGGQTGATFALRFRNPFANQPMLLLRTGLRAVIHDDKLG